MVVPPNVYVPAGNSSSNWSSGNSSERWLAALGEQLGKAVVLRAAGHIDIHDRVALRVEQLHRVPRLTVEEDLQTGITVGRVDLHLEPGVGELDRLRVGTRRSAQIEHGYGDGDGQPEGQ